jgi:hypothetical protein
MAWGQKRAGKRPGRGVGVFWKVAGLGRSVADGRSASMRAASRICGWARAMRAMRAMCGIGQDRGGVKVLLLP